MSDTTSTPPSADSDEQPEKSAKEARPPKHVIDDTPTNTQQIADATNEELSWKQ
jgi:hypothetical protein